MDVGVVRRAACGPSRRSRAAASARWRPLSRNTSGRPWIGLLRGTGSRRAPRSTSRPGRGPARPARSCQVLRAAAPPGSQRSSSRRAWPATAGLAKRSSTSSAKAKVSMLRAVAGVEAARAQVEQLALVELARGRAVASTSRRRRRSRARAWCRSRRRATAAGCCWPGRRWSSARRAGPRSCRRTPRATCRRARPCRTGR